ncbi:MAG TPA: methyltransferase domain-containing protein [Vicinamibacterales bacterium]|nr:methyltransferase domain-containing protein [Vicinamibacterales bacterium]
MTADELGRLERERLDADRCYNDALTALDRAVVAATTSPVSSAEALNRCGSALMVFAQQITAFVDTKDRQLAARLQRRVDELAAALDGISELRVQVGVLQRAIQTVAVPAATSDRGSAVIVQSVESGDFSPDTRSAVAYVGFEDQFRGTEAAIRDQLRPYVALFAGRDSIVDIGCGRGELLSELKAAGVSARGVDANAEMAAVARTRGLDATAGDALAYLTSLPDESLGGLAATQLVEHLEPGYLLRLLQTAAAKLQPGAPIILETINPACWLAFFSSYIRDLTHVRPVHPDTLQYLLRASGFSRVEIRYSAPVPEQVKMKTIDLPADVLTASDPSSRALTAVAHTINANAAILNNLMFTHQNYAAIGYRS